MSDKRKGAVGFALHLTDDLPTALDCRAMTWGLIAAVLSISCSSADDPQGAIGSGGGLQGSSASSSGNSGESGGGVAGTTSQVSGGSSGDTAAIHFGGDAGAAPGSGGATIGGGEAGGGASSGGATVGGAAGGSASGGSGGGVAGGNAVSLFDGTTLSGWLPSSGTGVGNRPDLWDVQDAALHCTGTVRGTLISAKDYGNFRLIFDVRQLPSTGTDNHYASVLIWGARPPPNDAIGGLQFGVPNGYFWDYRAGHNNSGAAYFVATSGGFSRTAWARCEILAQTATGVARMACCNLGTATSCKAKEVLKFSDPTAGRTGPIALQAHSAGSHDEYKDITIEENPAINALITTL
jgi:Domain of Unknown Function (DUF1080)